MSVKAWLLATFVLGAYAQRTCPVQYRMKQSQRPMLFGGVYDATCVGKCTDRRSRWGQECAFDPNRAGQFGVCTNDQRKLAYSAIMNYDKRALQLSPCQLFEYLRGRTLWILGDSFGQQYFTALQCFLVDFWGPSECRLSSDESLINPVVRLPLQPGNARCIHMPGNSRICFLRVVLGNQLLNNPRIPAGGVLPYLQQRLAKPQDIFIVNFAVWHRKAGGPGMAQYDASLKALGEFYKRTRGTFPHLLFRETPADHPKDVARKTCLPFRGLTYSSGQVRPAANARLSAGSALVARGGPFNAQARSITRSYGVPVFGNALWALSTTLYHQHVGIRNVADLDCLHYCNPGLPQLWVWDLYATLRSGTGGVAPLSGVNLNRTLACTALRG